MTKKCSRCKAEKPLEEFPWRNKAKGMRGSWCKPCKQAYETRHYHKNPKRREQIERQRLRNNQRTRDFILKAKSSGCVDCGELNPIVLDFDHVNGNKTYTIAKMTGWSLEKISSEIDKCEVVCSNCHRIRTHTRRLSS